MEALERYYVVFGGYSAVRWADGKSLRLAFTGENDPQPSVAIVFHTTYVPWDAGHTSAFLNAQVELSAGSMDVALRESNSVVAGLLSLLSVAANACIDQARPEVCLNISREGGGHEFWQYFEDRPFKLMQDRLAPDDAFESLLYSVMESPHRERLTRAIQQYAMALSHAGPGSELLAASHLWMAVEALTKAVLKREETNAGGREYLLKEWGIDVKQLDGEVRRRIIFGGNTELYRVACKTSNAFEHGFLNFGGLHNAASEWVSQFYRLVRVAIFELAELAEKSRSELEALPYAEPIGLKPLAFTVRTTLHGPLGSLAAAGSPFPHFRFEVDLVSSSSDDTGRWSSVMDAKLHPVLGDGVTWDSIGWSMNVPRDKVSVEQHVVGAKEEAQSGSERSEDRPGAERGHGPQRSERGGAAP